MTKPSQWDAKQLSELIRDQVLYELSSWELNDLIASLPDENEEQLDTFCKRYELGNWFYEALIINEIDIVNLLSDLVIERRQQEVEAERDRADIEHDYRQMQGYPS